MLHVSCTALQKRATDVLEEARGIVRELVDASRDRGLEAAFDKVARAAGLTPRRVRSYWHGAVHVGAVAAHELDGLRAAQAAHMRAEMARCEHRLAVLRARLGGGGAVHSQNAGVGAVCHAPALA